MKTFNNTWDATDKKYIVPLHRLCVSNIDERHRKEKIAEWLETNCHRVSLAEVRSTLVGAARRDLADIFVPVHQVALRDKVKSRLTGRVGTVTQIKADGETIVVQWDSGGTQLMSQAKVYRINKESDIHNINNYSKLQLEADPYDELDQTVFDARNEE